MKHRYGHGHQTRPNRWIQFKNLEAFARQWICKINQLGSTLCYNSVKFNKTQSSRTCCINKDLTIKFENDVSCIGLLSPCNCLKKIPSFCLPWFWTSRRKLCSCFNKCSLVISYKHTTQPGKEILIKAVVEVIPSYVVGCFWLPMLVCNDVEALIVKFFLELQCWWEKDSLD